MRPKKEIEPLETLESLPRQLPEITEDDKIAGKKPPPKDDSKTLQ